MIFPNLTSPGRSPWSLARHVAWDAPFLLRLPMRERTWHSACATSPPEANSHAKSNPWAAARFRCKWTSPTFGKFPAPSPIPLAHFGKLDILVNNAGNGFINLAVDITEHEFDATLAINLKATFFAAQAAAKIMIRQNGGRIINMSSQAGFAALPTESIYCASKAAVSHLTKCLAVEWGKHNITVNAVAPTFIATPGTDEALSDPAFPHRRD